MTLFTVSVVGEKVVSVLVKALIDLLVDVEGLQIVEFRHKNLVGELLKLSHLLSRPLISVRSGR